MSRPKCCKTLLKRPDFSFSQPAIVSKLKKLDSFVSADSVADPDFEASAVVSLIVEVEAPLPPNNAVLARWKVTRRL